MSSTLLCSARRRPFYRKRGISFLCAVFAAWQVNRSFAFKAAVSLSLWQEWWRYLLAILGGGVANYLCSAAAVMLLPPGPLMSMPGVAIGGMSVKFISSKLFVFTSREHCRRRFLGACDDTSQLKHRTYVCLHAGPDGPNIDIHASLALEIIDTDIPRNDGHLFRQVQR